MSTPACRQVTWMHYSRYTRGKRAGPSASPISRDPHLFDSGELDHMHDHSGLGE